MRLIAHRGFAGLYPENTLRAVEEAVALADAIEVDVRRCGSGELVVIHDATVDRVTDGSGAVAAHDLRELRGLDVLGTGRGVPTLEEVLSAVPPAIGVTLDLREVGLCADALRTAAAVDSQVTVSSPHASELEGCRGADAAVPRAYLAGPDADREEAIDMATDLDCTYLHPHADVCDERLVEAAHRAGMSVNAWPVDARSEAEALEDAGVDGVIADRWGVLPEAAP